MIHGRSGCRRIVPVALQGASSNTKGAGACRPPIAQIRLHQFRFKPKPRQIFAHARQPCRFAFDRGDVRAHRCKLRGLAAGCRAKIDHALTRAHRQAIARAAKPLHPAPTMRRLRIRAIDRRGPPRASRTILPKTGSASGSAAPSFNAISSGGGERCAARDLARGIFAISVAPPRPHPVRRVEAWRILSLREPACLRAKFAATRH